MVIESINNPSDVKKLKSGDIEILADEIRRAIIGKMSATGGHVASNLGIVELTIALHRVFDIPRDRLIFDVSHQTYAHKILTGRKKAFLDREHFGDVSGFADPAESECDPFRLGHTSTSISLACGLAQARDMKGEKHNIIAVIGDGSLSGGIAFEALNRASEACTNMIIVVNDNEMSIAENHGGLYGNLAKLRETDGKYPNNFFTSLGFEYVFERDGNNAEKLCEIFQSVKDSQQPVVVHVVTKKGKGFEAAEKEKEKWHWHAPFDGRISECGNSNSNAANSNNSVGDNSRDSVSQEDNLPGSDLCSENLQKNNFKDEDLKMPAKKEDYRTYLGEFMLKKMQSDNRVLAVTAATPSVFDFFEDKRVKADSQYIDLGIAEQNAAGFVCGCAAEGLKPVMGVYSSFIMRSIDQLFEEAALNAAPAVFAVGNASIWGTNDVTHLGIFDIPILSHIPGLVYLAPTTLEEMYSMMNWAISCKDGPVAVRIPAGKVYRGKSEPNVSYSLKCEYCVTRKGSGIAVIAAGGFYHLGEAAAEVLSEKYAISPTVVNPRYLSGVDAETLENLKIGHNAVLTLEDGVVNGGFGAEIARYYADSDMKVLVRGLKNEFIDRYDPAEVLESSGLTAEKLALDAFEAYQAFETRSNQDR